VSVAMKNIRYLIKSSFYDHEDDGGTVATTAWRLLTSSLSCVLDGDGHNTGMVHGATLEEFTIATGVATGPTKPNTPSDPDHIADYVDSTMCPPYAPPPSNTAELFTNRGAPCNATLVNGDGVHSYDMNGVTDDLTIPIAAGTYSVSVTPNLPGSPNAIINCNGVIVTIPAGSTHTFTGVVANISITVNFSA